MYAIFFVVLSILTSCSGGGLTPQPKGDTAFLDSGPLDLDRDLDQDGYTTESDCDDLNASVYPGADELCDDLDNDCDGETDEDAIDVTEWYPDRDEDTYGSNEDKPLLACDASADGYVQDNTDCDDYNGAVNPDAREVCDGLDNDCNTYTDSDDPGIDISSTQEWFPDNDRDGYGKNSQQLYRCTQPSGYLLDNTDCDDSRSDVNPGATEVCDGIDNDCDDDIDGDDDDISCLNGTP